MRAPMGTTNRICVVCSSCTSVNEPNDSAAPCSTKPTIVRAKPAIHAGRVAIRIAVARRPRGSSSARWPPSCCIANPNVYSAAATTDSTAASTRGA